MKICRKPEWLQKKINLGEQKEMRQMLSELRLNTVCQQALCPNISECFSAGEATFLILGKICSRLCSFCNIEKRVPLPPDTSEPARVAEAVKRLKLSHVVITSPTRDDLSDGGAAIYAATVSEIRNLSPTTKVELLIPDFQGKVASLMKVTDSKPDIIAHNLETVPRLYHIREGADYHRSLELLQKSVLIAPEIKAKSGVMLGMGETEDELLQLFCDLQSIGCSYLSIGQYLPPSRNHYPVKEYINPSQFDSLREKAMNFGFIHVESAPFVRSSYHAAKYI